MGRALLGGSNVTSRYSYSSIVVCVVATTVVLDCTIQLVGTAIVVCVVATTVVYNRRSTRLKV